MVNSDSLVNAKLHDGELGDLVIKPVREDGSIGDLSLLFHFSSQGCTSHICGRNCFKKKNNRN